MFLATAPFAPSTTAAKAKAKALAASEKAAISIEAKRVAAMKAASDNGKQYPTYVPKYKSVGWNTLLFFIQWPDDMLHSEDIALKWDATPRNASTLLRPCVKAGYLITTPQEQTEGRTVGRPTQRYEAGPKLHIAAALMHQRAPNEVPAKPAATPAA